MYLLVDVDDIFITGSDAAVIENVITRVNVVFKLTKLGILNYFLGMDVQGHDDYLLIS